jgi:hypothetical protein
MSEKYGLSLLKDLIGWHSRQSAEQPKEWKIERQEKNYQYSYKLERSKDECRNLGKM